MRLTRGELAGLVVMLFSFIVGIYLYPQMPERMASHWNAAGEVDGYMSRFWGVFLLPLVIGGVALLLIAIPRIDPLKSNIEKFRSYYDWFIVLFSVFLFALYLQTLLWNLGTRISPNLFMPIGLGVLYFYLGVLLEHAKRNWFIGIRTPWTLSSDRVWDKTHKLGAKLFKIAGVLSLVGVFFQPYAVLFVVVPVVTVAAVTMVYSYLEYQQENHQGRV